MKDSVYIPNEMFYDSVNLLTSINIVSHPNTHFLQNLEVPRPASVRIDLFEFIQNDVYYPLNMIEK